MESHIEEVQLGFIYTTEFKTIYDYFLDANKAVAYVQIRERCHTGVACALRREQMGCCNIVLIYM